MKKCTAVLTVLFLLLMTASAFAASSAVTKDGYCKGIRLCGKVKVVTAFPDLKVQVVTSFPDLKVKVVDAFPTEIGKWQFVEHGEDFKIQYVNSFPDLKIQFVDAFPGVQ